METPADLLNRMANPSGWGSGKVLLARSRSSLVAAACLSVFCARLALAQTQPYGISTYQGNGQLICLTCPSAGGQGFQPLVAQVVGANGLPVVNLSVNWQVAAGGGALQYSQTVTDVNGLASNVFSVYSGLGRNVSSSTSVVTAGVGSSQATFYETQAASGLQVVFSPPASLSGVAGSTGPPITVAVGSSGGAIADVEIRLLNNQASPSVFCAPGPVPADPGTVLTDVTGTATCNPVLAGSGAGQFSVLVGGVTASATSGQPVAYASYGPFPLTVAAPPIGAILLVSGNNQTAAAGRSLPSPLVARVTDTNGNPEAGQTVTWSVSPAGAGTLAALSTVSDVNGLVQNGFTLSTSASGLITIAATAAGNAGISAKFSVTAIPLVTVSSLQKVSGDGQTALSGQAFASPLVVLVTSASGQPIAGVAVAFSVSGPATLSATTVVTNSAGQAQLIVQAGATASQAAVTVTAFVGSLAVTFTLAVIPPGPMPTPGSFVNAADQKVGSLSPCSLATLIAPGVAPSIQGTVTGASFGPAPLTLAGIGISFPNNPAGDRAAPIFGATNNGGQQSVTFQVPCSTPSGSVPVTVSVGGSSATITVPVLPASPGIFGTPGADGVMRAVLERPDGSFVSLANPARRGETVVAMVTGLGPASPAVGTNQVPPRGTPANVTGAVIPGVNNSGAALVSARLTTNQVGVYRVSFVIPASVSAGNSVGLSIGVIPAGASTANYSNQAYFPVK